MKKSVKILMLVLTLALVCGVFAVSAFAASADGVGYDYANHTPATGEVLYSYMDFEATSFVSDKATNYTINEYSQAVNSGSNVTSNNGKAFQLIFANRSGNAWIDSIPQEDNKFLVIWNDKTTLAKAGQGPYFSAASANTPGNGADAEKHPERLLSAQKAMVVDYDIKFGEGKVPTSTGMNIHLRRYRADGVRDFINITGENGGGIMNSINVLFRMDGDKIKLYTQDSGWNTSSFAIPVEEWMHITVVLEAPVDNNGTPDNTADDKFDAFHLYVYINDKLALATKKFNVDSLSAADFYNGNQTYVSVPEIRWSFGVDNVENAAEIALDNFAVRNFSYDYDATGLDASLASGDLSTWEGSLYDADLLPYGVTVATIERGDKTVEFDNLKEAIAAAQPGEVIKLMANIAEQIEVANVVTIDKNGFTANLTAATGYAVFDGDTDDVAGNEGTYYSQESSGGLRVMWGACGCGDHFDSVTVTVPLNNNIYDSFFAACGKLPECSYLDGDMLKVLAGWTASGNAGIAGELSEDAVVTAAMVGKTLRLAPVYDSFSATAQVLDTNGNLKKQYYQNTAFAEIINACQPGETIQLLANYDNPGSGVSIGVGKNIIIDLNGYRIAVYTVDAKHYTFTVGGNVNVTVKSSKAGGQLYNVKGNSGNNQYNGDTIFAAGGAGASVTLNGADADGNLTLTTYSATLVQGWNVRMNATINGGEYHRNASDNTAFIDLRGGGQLSLNDAYLNGGGCLLRVSNVDATAPRIVNIDNCTIDGTIMNGIDGNQASDLVVNITNSRIHGAINATLGSWTIGAGTYISEAATISDVVKYAEGTKAFNISLTETYTVLTNKFEYTHATGSWGNSFVPFEQEKSATYNRVVLAEDAKPVKVTWYDTDGVTVLGVTEDAYAGTKASAPVTEVAGTDGWVMACYADWSDNAIVPAGVTEYAFTLKADSGVTYSAGKINIMFNFDMIAHFQYNFYVPTAPEGITFVNATFNGAVGNGVVTSGSAATDTQGNKYICLARWPGAAGTAQNSGVTINYTYNGQSISYTSPSFTIADYANFVFENEKYEGTPLVTAMADMLAYVNAANVLTSKTPLASFTAIYNYAVNEGLVTPTDDLKTETIDLSDAAQYFTDVTIAFNTALNGMSIQVTAAEGYSIGFKAETNHGYIVIGQTRRFSNDGAFCAHNIRTWGIADTFTIQVYDGHTMHTDNQTVLYTGHNVVAEFEYSLAAYLGANMDKLAENELNYVKAILAYGSSAGAYMDWKVQNGIGK